MDAPPPALLQRLTAPGPKRLLALDGGGMRGLIALGYLARIETEIRQRLGKPGLVLADYFDLIGGTSTGAIIAAQLAFGLSVSDIRARYLDMGPRIFRKRRFGWWRSVFDDRPLIEAMDAILQGARLDDPRLRTGLCVVAKRADTNSTWPLLNHPGGMFYAENRSLLLRDVVRASTAVPVGFSPSRFEVAPGQPATFVDGAVSMANNPALLLFLVATLRGFPFHWATGESRMLLVSVGTGTWERRIDAQEMARHKAWDWMLHVPTMLMQDATALNQTLLQALGRALNPVVIDREIGDLSGDRMVPEPLFTYVRYSPRLEAAALAEIGLSELAGRVELLRRLDRSDLAPALALIGERGADAQFKPAHLPTDFDPAP